MVKMNGLVGDLVRQTVQSWSNRYKCPDHKMEYEKLTVPKLKDELRARGLPTTGNKAVLVARLKERTGAPLALPPNDDVALEIMTNTEYNTLKALCSIDARADRLCKRPILWRNRTIKEFGFDPEQYYATVGLSHRDIYRELVDAAESSKLLQLAIERGYVQLVDRLLPLPPNPIDDDAIDNWENLMEHAILFDQVNIFNQLLSGLPVQDQKETECRWIAYALEHGSVNVANVLAPSIGKCDAQAMLVAATNSNDPSLIALVMSYDLEINNVLWSIIVNDAVMVAVDTRDTSGLNYLVAKMPDDTHPRISSTAFRKILKSGDLGLLKEILALITPAAYEHISINLRTKIIGNVLDDEQYDDKYKEYVRNVLLPSSPTTLLKSALSRADYDEADKLVRDRPELLTDAGLVNEIGETGSTDTIKFLLDHGIRADRLYHSNRTDYAYYKLLIENGLPVDIYALIDNIVEHNWNDLLDIYVQRDPDSLLKQALGYDNVMIAELVLPRINRIDPEVITYTHSRLLPIVIKWFKDHSIDIPQSVLNDKLTRLLKSSAAPTEIETILNAGAKPTEKNMITAVSGDTVDIIRMLISAGGKVTTKVFLSAVDALETYAQRDRVKLIELLLNAGANIHAGTDALLGQAINLNDKSLTRYALDNGARTAALNLEQKQRLRKWKLM